ncbi:hypothetical protein PILCRDRAFT_816184 [Piloderma croceum F 1598]|uniref:Uncharacterized protein n=1 Tax=Piloderma croceum (strain F 1598) TaxID=765440 RepID=A0A0C3FQ48_PILCF|nr:hypothetical protein PILCRDRAFT_816184 [Piloderma croceum F 1598]
MTVIPLSRSFLRAKTMFVRYIAGLPTKFSQVGFTQRRVRKTKDIHLKARNVSNILCLTSESDVEVEHMRCSCG